MNSAHHVVITVDSYRNYSRLLVLCFPALDIFAIRGLGPLAVVDDQIRIQQLHLID